MFNKFMLKLRNELSLRNSFVGLSRVLFISKNPKTFCGDA